eukprot:gnl/TRDRNA2_/TRDRNA2_156062_c0_seq2.p1 gnl/TRDRNA2_/TRDRNA2_156062_c0~~gnl/TRDRNA2_/TRDRNA2_156062_c0_seq2.p1  ORF type:complete len:245 (-),score=14.68 gnl/TRDRNA2_/TRDRNA2_156062_c0_seq2:269-910(-)
MVPQSEVSWLRNIIEKHARDVQPPYVWKVTDTTYFSQIRLSQTNGVHLDLWHVQEPTGHNHKLNCQQISYTKWTWFVPSFWLFPLHLNGCIIQGQKFTCPRNRSALLDHMYGDWRVPGGKFPPIAEILARAQARNESGDLKCLLLGQDDILHKPGFHHTMLTPQNVGLRTPLSSAPRTLPTHSPVTSSKYGPDPLSRRIKTAAEVMTELEKFK